MRPFDFPKGTVAFSRRFLAVAALATCAAIAQAVSISPVLVELTPGHRIVSITFSNPGDQPISFQSRPMAWRIVDGVDEYQPTDDLIVAPPIATIAAGGSQIFRVALRGPATGREQAYRLIFEDATVASTPTGNEVAIRIRINHDLPVFVAAAGEPKARLRIGPCLGKTPARADCVRIDNDGERYAQLKTLAIDRGGWHKDLPINSRILAGAWREWTLPLPAGSTGAVRASVQSSEGVVSAELPASGR